MSEPLFKLGQWVYFNVEAETAGIKLSQWTKLCIVVVRLSSDSERQTFTYDLSTDPPQAYHYGSGVQFTCVDEKLLRQLNPLTTEGTT